MKESPRCCRWFLIASSAAIDAATVPRYVPVRIGFQLSRDPRYSHAGQALMDKWSEFVMAHAVRRDETGCHEADGDDGERTTRPRPRRSVRRTLFA